MPISDCLLPLALTQARWMLLAAMVATIAVAVYQGYRHYKRYKAFAVHQEGLIYRSAWLAPDAVAEIVERFGIRTVINLCDAVEKGGGRIEAERRAVHEAGGRLVELVFPPNAQWSADDAVYRRFEQLIDEPENYPLYIHCQHGRERTVKALAICDIRRRGMSAKASLAAMPLFGDGHSWPIITFAHLYEDFHKAGQALVEGNQEALAGGALAAAGTVSQR